MAADFLFGRALLLHLLDAVAVAQQLEVLPGGEQAHEHEEDADTIYAVPTEIADHEDAAAQLCKALGDCTKKERAALADRIDRGRAFVYVRRQVSPEQAKRVAALQLNGIGFMKENRRFYPNKELAANLLGYTGIDNLGLHGIEAAYDSLIKGKPGTVLIQTDARRHAFSRIEKPPTTGADLELTIDQYLQHIAERELKAGVLAHKAAGGSAVVMDPHTGEILAIASYPTFNPNAYREYDAEHRRNRATQDLYEPGSTFKIITASAALEEKVVTPDDPVDVSGGTIRFGSRVIRDDHRYGVLTFRGVIAKSSNVGSIKVGLRLGAERFGSYVKRFGFGKRLSPDFPGENAGIVWNPAKLNDSALASMLIGYQVGVTPLQMAAAVSAVANGGELIQPRVVRAVIRGDERLPVPRKVLGRAISESTAAELRVMLEGVTEQGGTATRAQIAGFTVAGKTGTAAKLVDGRYSKTFYNASFVGFVPSQKPVYTIVVVIDSPRAGTYYGGTVAAPIFQKIADAALRYTGVPPTINAPPPLMVARRGIFLAARPTAGPTELPPIITLAGASPGSSSLFPDLRGLSARDALRALARLGLTANMRGTGVVVSQRPEPGAPIERGGAATLWLERQMPTQVARAGQP